jgi:hypothetical protein
VAQNLREQIADDIVEILQQITDPRPVLVTREPFQPDRLAITQFPALLVSVASETRETITMGAPGSGIRQATLTFNIRGYVRGEQLDKRRNDLIEAVEEALDADRYRSQAHVMDSQITAIEVVERQPPLAEIRCEYEVVYNFVRGTA